MNTITLTKSQAERCMREDALFKCVWSNAVYRCELGTIIYWDNSVQSWIDSTAWGEYVYWTLFPTCTIHSDPNKTYEKLFGKTDMTNETEQKYLTRSEALKAMEEGRRVKASGFGTCTEFWLCEDGKLGSTQRGMSVWEVFGSYTQYTLVPQPDSPEKFVRDLHGMRDVFNADESLELSSAARLEFGERLHALIQQMDERGGSDGVN